MKIFVNEKSIKSQRDVLNILSSFLKASLKKMVKAISTKVHKD